MHRLQPGKLSLESCTVHVMQLNIQNVFRIEPIVKIEVVAILPAEYDQQNNKKKRECKLGNDQQLTHTEPRESTGIGYSFQRLNGIECAKVQGRKHTREKPGDKSKQKEHHQHLPG